MIDIEFRRGGSQCMQRETATEKEQAQGERFDLPLPDEAELA